jgi:hypothetical protein
LIKKNKTNKNESNLPPVHAAVQGDQLFLQSEFSEKHVDSEEDTNILIGQSPTFLHAPYCFLCLCIAKQLNR